MQLGSRLPACYFGENRATAKLADQGADDGEKRVITEKLAPPIDQAGVATQKLGGEQVPDPAKRQTLEQLGRAVSLWSLGALVGVGGRGLIAEQQKQLIVQDSFALAGRVLDDVLAGTYRHPNDLVMVYDSDKVRIGGLKPSTVPGFSEFVNKLQAAIENRPEY